MKLRYFHQAILLILLFGTSAANAGDTKNSAGPVSSKDNESPSEDVGVCFSRHGNINAPGDFIFSVVDVLENAYTAISVAKEAGPKSETTKVVTAIYSANQHFNCGVKTIHDYKKSIDENMATSATGLEGALQDLVRLNKQNIEFMKAVLDGKINIDSGTSVDFMAKQTLGFENAYKMLAMSVVMGTFALIDSSKKEFRITKKQRDEACARLKKIFGSHLTKPKTFLEVGASGLNKFLNDKWKFAPKKKKT